MLFTDKGADLNARDDIVYYYYTCIYSTHVLMRCTNKKDFNYTDMRYEMDKIW